MSDKYDEYNNYVDDTSSDNTFRFNSYNNSGSQTSNSYAYVSNNSGNSQKPKKHTWLKVTAVLLSLGIIGGISVQGVKIYKGQQKDTTLSEFKEENTTTAGSEQTTTSNNTSSTSISDRNEVSLFQIAARTDAKPLPEIVDSIMPSFVGISSTFEVKNSGFGYGWGSPSTQRFTSTGTGIIMTSDGYIVTNAHVIYDNESQYAAGKAVEVSVLYSDESVHVAKIVAYDIKTDIAVLKVDETGLKPATFGNSDDLKVGELVIAVGNPLGFEFFGTVTSGIVSATNRRVTIGDKDMTLIQTDAAINSGNSGGPLLNSCGQVIGINSAKMSSSYGSTTIEGIGFAIPINEAQTIVNDLINYKYVKGRPQIGITTFDITENYSRYLNLPMGVYVRSIEEGSSADEAGLMIGDVIIDADGKTITNGTELIAVKNAHKAGDTIKLKVYRSGRDLTIEMVLKEESAPDEQQ